MSLQDDNSGHGKGSGLLSLAAPLLRLVRRLLPWHRQSGGGGAEAWIPWILLVLFVCVVAYYAVPRKKSYFLDITTDYFSIITDADTQNVWEISEASVCLPLHKIEIADYADFERVSGGRCAEDAYLELRLRGMELDWPAGVTLVMRPGLGRSLDVVIADHAADSPVRLGQIPATDESILSLPWEVFSEFGGLGVTGRFIAGQLAENGTLMLLRDGKYETREHFWLRGPARIVDSGAFSLGDVVSIEPRRSGEMPASYAFLTLTAAGDPAGAVGASLRAIVSSDLGYGRLRLDRAKSRETFLEPNWAQRLAIDPVAIGFATILGLFGATLGVIGAFRRKE